jgi:hypothetical protein
LASMYGGNGNSTDFCTSRKDGATFYLVAGSLLGVAPAFCVK